MELRQSAGGVGKKLQTELAYDGIERSALERERLDAARLLARRF
jgi:hypothetical protein